MTTRRAFTLIEVLLAVFIIALGSIGIFALLAGVAQQQGRATDLGRGVAQAQGLIGSMRGRVGPIGEWIASNGQPQIDPVFGEPLAPGVWYPAFAYYDAGGPLSPSLTVNPRAQTNILGGRYFVAPKEEYLVYSNPPVFDGSSQYSPLNGPAGFGQNEWLGGSADFAGGVVSRLPFIRAALGTVEIEFWKTDRFTGEESLAVTIDDFGLPAMISHPELLFDYEMQLPKGADPSTDEVAQFSYAERVNSPQVTADPDNLAGLLSFDLQSSVGPDEWISAIRVRAAFRQDQLMSLGERVRTVLDPTRPSGRRATAGATVLYRVSPSGRSQFITLAYAVNPLDRGGVFVPPEEPEGRNESATTGILRVSDEYRLFYDTTRAEYYLEWDVDDDALAVGDVLIVGGQLDAMPTSPRNVQGADNPVRVTRVIEIENTPRAYLDDSPRTGARSMLENINDSAGIPIFRVYSLRRQARSLFDDSPWELRPVVAQTLDVQ